jgi:hypothetical protein
MLIIKWIICALIPTYGKLQVTLLKKRIPQDQLIMVFEKRK